MDTVQFPDGNEEFFILARKSRACAEAYIGTPHKQVRRLTPPGRKRTVSGRNLISWCFPLPAPAQGRPAAKEKAGAGQGPDSQVKNDFGTAHCRPREEKIFQRISDVDRKNFELDQKQGE